MILRIAETKALFQNRRSHPLVPGKLPASDKAIMLTTPVFLSGFYYGLDIKTGLVRHGNARSRGAPRYPAHGIQTLSEELCSDSLPDCGNRATAGVQDFELHPASGNLFEYFRPHTAASVCVIIAVPAKARAGTGRKRAKGGETAKTRTAEPSKRFLGSGLSSYLCSHLSHMVNEMECSAWGSF